MALTILMIRAASSDSFLISGMNSLTFSSSALLPATSDIRIFRLLPTEDGGTCSKVRAFVEHPRAWMVKMGYTFARYRGLACNALDFALMAIAYDLKNSFHLLGHPLTPARAN